jgi:predicted PurR-regulated permease PerM
MVRFKTLVITKYTYDTLILYLYYYTLIRMNNNQVIHQNQIRQVFFIIILVGIGLLLFFELASFLPALLGAITLYIIMRRWMFYLCYTKEWKKGWAAALLMILSMIVILFPIFILINMLSSKVAFAIEHSNELVTALKKIVADIEQRFNADIVSNENINKLGAAITNGIPKLLSATFNTLTTIVFMYFILYFMLVNGRKMEVTIYEHIPLQDDNVNRLGKEVKNMVISNAVGIPLIAFLQGVVGLIGYLIIGVKEPWFLVCCHLYHGDAACGGCGFGVCPTGNYFLCKRRGTKRGLYADMGISIYRSNR